MNKWKKRNHANHPSFETLESRIAFSVSSAWFETLDAAAVSQDIIFGDYDRSGTVDTADYELWQTTYGSTVNLAADGNFDGVVDLADYSVWRSNRGNTGTPAVMKPSSDSLVAKDQWVVRLTEDALEQVTSPSHAVESLPALSEAGLRVLGGTGLVGELLIEAVLDDPDSAELVFGQTGIIDSFEANAISESDDIIPNDSGFYYQWGLHNQGQVLNYLPNPELNPLVDADIDAPAAWQVTQGSSDIVVAVLDTGVDYTHPDLARNIWQNTSEIAGNGVDDDGNGYIDDVVGYDFAYNDSDPSDFHGHGTHVAGTIGAVGDNGRGVSGVAWDVSIMPVKVLGDRGIGSSWDVARGINYVTLMKERGVDVRVMNMSLGSSVPSRVVQSAIESARESGILIVAAAGNDAVNLDVMPHYPASYDIDNIITVGATNQRDQLSSFSNYGSSVDIAAPGEHILSTTPGVRYGTKSGTSMAAPHVSGTLALMAAYATTDSYSDLREKLLDGSDQVASLNGLISNSRRLNALDALFGESVLPAHPPELISRTPTFEWWMAYQRIRSLTESPGSPLIQITSSEFEQENTCRQAAPLEPCRTWSASELNQRCHSHHRILSPQRFDASRST